MALEKPRICWGVKAKGSKRLRCGEEVNDPRIIEEVNRLINEFLARVERHKNVLLDDESTPFNYAINALSDWLREIRSKIKEGGNEDIARLRRAMLNVGETMLKLAKKAREKWLRTYKQELEELIGKLGKGETTIIIKGEPFNNDKSFGVSLYTEHLSIAINKVAKSSDVTIFITLNDLNSVHVNTPILFNNDVLKTMQYGLMLTDGAINKEGYPEMSTSHLWQVIVWLMAWLGKNYMRIHSLNINDSDVGITWRLIAMDYMGKFRNKSEIAKNVLNLVDEEFLIFLLFAILGDGDINAKKKIIRLTIGSSKYELWSNITKKMISYGFKEHDRKYKKVMQIFTSRAAAIARKMLGNSAVKSLIENLSQLPDTDKLRGLIELANTRIKPLGGSSVEVVDGISMNVHVNNTGYVRLRTMRKNYEDTMIIQERLKPLVTMPN